ncbi:hypothetical protein Pfo_021963, partial [Paulownia fortunei]
SLDKKISSLFQSNTMQIHHEQQSFGVGMLRKLVFLFLLALVVSAGENNETMVVGSRKISASKLQEKQLGKVDDQQLQRQLERLRVKHAFDAFFSSKRRVPNESDPLHNR